MKNKPFVWFRVSRTIDLKSLKEFNDSVAGNFGLALNSLGIRKNGLEILQEINSTLKIPLAFFIPGKFNLKDKKPAFIQKKMISLETASLRYLEFNKKYIPCYKIHIAKKHGVDISKLMSELSEYFMARALYPSREIILDFNPQDEKLFPEYFRIMVKLGIETMLLLYDKKHLGTVQAYFSDKSSGLNTDTSNETKIFEAWRIQVDELDNQLIETISKRLEIVKEMGAYKTQRAIPLFEAERWREIIRSRKEISKTKGVDEYFIEKIFEAIHLLGLKKMLEE
jgi:chorismate mutase